MTCAPAHCACPLLAQVPRRAAAARAHGDGRDVLARGEQGPDPGKTSGPWLKLPRLEAAPVPDGAGAGRRGPDGQLACSPRPCWRCRGAVLSAAFSGRAKRRLRPRALGAGRGCRAGCVTVTGCRRWGCCSPRSPARRRPRWRPGLRGTRTTPPRNRAMRWPGGCCRAGSRPPAGRRARRRRCGSPASGSRSRFSWQLDADEPVLVMTRAVQMPPDLVYLHDVLDKVEALPESQDRDRPGRPGRSRLLGLE